MNRLRYFLGLLVFLAIFAFCVFGSGGNLLVLVDILSIFITLGVTIALLRTGWTFREMGKAFSTAFDNDASKESLLFAEAFFVAMGRYLNLSAVLGIVMGLVFILRNLSDKSMLGPNLAVAMISILYVVLLQMAVVVPMRAMIQKKQK